MNKIIKCLKQKIISNKYFLIISAILLTYYIIYFPSEHNANIYNFNFYVVSYKYGFISRGFIGSLFNFIFTTVTIKKVYLVLNLLFISFIFLTAYLFQKLINKYENKLLGFLTILLCIFTPASFLLMITMNEFGRFDIFVFGLTIVSLVLIYKDKLLFLVPIISFIAILIHQNFLFMYAPLILMILIYKYRIKKLEKCGDIFIITLLSIIFAFGLIMAYGQPTGYNTAKDFANELQKTTDIPIPYEKFTAIDAEYFREISDHTELVKSRFNGYPKKNFAIAIILLLSFMYLQYKLLYQYLFSKQKTIILLLIISCFGSLPLYFIGVDYGRWYIAIINSLVLLFVYLSFENINLINQKVKMSESTIISLISMIVFYILIMPDTVFTFMKFTKISYMIEKLKYFLYCLT